MDYIQLLQMLLRIIANSKKIPELSEITSLNGVDYFIVHSDALGRGVKITAGNALVPVDLIVRESTVSLFPLPGNLNKIYIATTENAVYHWDQYLGAYVMVAGGEDKNYLHDQAIPAASWVIAHNLNKFPSVTVIDTAGTEVIGETIHTNLNNLTITFNAAFSGKATLN